MDWDHLVTRRLSVQTAIAWNRGFGAPMEQAYGAGILDTLSFFDGAKTDYHVERTAHARFGARLDALLHDAGSVATLIPDARAFLEAQHARIRDLVEGAQGLDARALERRYREVAEEHARYYTRMWMVFRIGERLAQVLGEELRAAVGEQRADALARAFSAPLEPNEAMREQWDLERIPPARKDLVALHAQRYRHIPMFDFDHEPWTEEDFARRIAAADPSPASEGSLFERRREEFERQLAALAPGDRLRGLILMQRDTVILRDHRDAIRQRLNLLLREFYRGLGSRIGLGIGEVALLTDDEIAEHVRESAAFSREEIARRRDAFLLVQHDADAILRSGDDAREEARRLLPGEEARQREVKGATGSPGKARGPARIVHTNLGLHKVRDGDVLIAHMTRQDFVPYLRHVVALVTDEGGIGCHAAIIARELRIPCIVGTRTATSAFRDGDPVEVDADAGTVRLIDRV